MAMLVLGFSVTKLPWVTVYVERSSPGGLKLCSLLSDTRKSSRLVMNPGGNLGEMAPKTSSAYRMK